MFGISTLWNRATDCTTGWLFVIAVLASAVAERALAAASVVPHRAAYELSLKTTSGDSEVVSVSGGMTFEWADKCDAWEVRESYLMRVLNNRSHEVELAGDYLGWESKDGLRYQFEIKRREFGESKVLRGSAWLTEVGGPGIAEFEEPERDTFVLPSDTVFPTQHTLLLIDAAQRGERFDRRMLFDGSEFEGAIPVSSVLLDARPARRPPALSKQITRTPLFLDAMWPMTIAFFDPAESDAPASFELQLEMQANGVATSVVLDYGDFKVDAKLARLEALPATDC